MKVIRRRLAASIGGFALVVALAASASAQKRVNYPADPNSRTFATSAGGWSDTTTSDGLCVPVLLCPTPENTFEPSDGQGGSNDGFIRTSISGLAGVAGNVTGIWQSPSFVYRGIDGRTSDRLHFFISRRAEISDLVDVGGGSADFTAEIVPSGSGVPVAVPFDSVNQTDTVEKWIKLGPAEIAPGDLRIGQSYAIRIITRFTFGSTVIPGASVDYDNVGLVALPPERRFDTAFMNGFIQNNMRNWIGIRGGKGLVLVRCPGRARQLNATCRFDLTMLWKRRGPAASASRTVNLVPLRVAVASLPIRAAYRSSVLRRPMILVRFRFSGGPVTATVYKNLRVVNCARAAVC